MSEPDVERVLRNWIEQALSPCGQLANQDDAAMWVTRQFTAWWRSQVLDSLEFAELSASRLREELRSLHVSHGLDEALHELTHLQDGLADLRKHLGVVDDADPAS